MVSFPFTTGFNKVNQDSVDLICRPPVCSVRGEHQMSVCFQMDAVTWNQTWHNTTTRHRTTRLHDSVFTSRQRRGRRKLGTDSICPLGSGTEAATTRRQQFLQPRIRAGGEAGIQILTSFYCCWTLTAFNKQSATVTSGVVRLVWWTSESMFRPDRQRQRQRDNPRPPRAWGRQHLQNLTHQNVTNSIIYYIQSHLVRQQITSPQ